MKMTLPERKSPRLKNFDYSSPNYYFVTICTHEKRCLFGKTESLSKMGKIAAEGIEKIPQHFQNIEVDHHAVMPNHVHMILVLKENCKNFSLIIGAYKAYVTRAIHQWSPDTEIWQRSFHDHVIRDQRSYEKIWTYVENNPIKWEEDCFYTDYI